MPAARVRGDRAVETGMAAVIGVALVLGGLIVRSGPGRSLPTADVNKTSGAERVGVTTRLTVLRVLHESRAIYGDECKTAKARLLDEGHDDS
jgi:hypothetical protein